MEAGAAGLFLSWLGKLPGLAVRFALIFELLVVGGTDLRGHGGADEPSRHAVDAAVTLIASYLVPMARRTFGEAALPQADRDATTLARWLLAQSPLPGIVNARDLRHADALPTREADRYDAALAEITLAGWVKPAPHSPVRVEPEKIFSSTRGCGGERVMTVFYPTPMPKCPKPPEIRISGGNGAFGQGVCPETSWEEEVRPPLPMPPHQAGEWVLELPDHRTAPLAGCARCRFIAPMSPRGLCGACECKRQCAP